MKEPTKLDKIFAAIVFAAAVLGVIYLLVTPVAAAGYTVTVCDDGGATPLPEGIPCDEVDKPSMTYIGSMYVTGYDACAKCCGKTDGITASGTVAEVGRTVAMCRDYPFGTVIYIDGLGYYTVEDRGVGKGCVDVFVNNHSEAFKITGHYDCWIVEGE